MTVPIDADNSIYRRTTRHWHPGSEKWAGADCLLTAMDNGWQVDSTVYCQEFWRPGARLITVYHFELSKGDQRLDMPVITNPYARRLIRRMKNNVQPFEQREAIRSRQRDG